MIHASLFSGIGGFDLAAEWMGWENAFHCEINKWCSRVLKYHFPNSKHYADITKTDFTEWRGKVDIITGGFPCQPFSLAGQRKGAADDRYLWPEMLRVIREVRPTWVIGENVGGIVTMVQPGEEIEVEYQYSLFEEGNKETILEQEFVIETICRDLEREGYSVQPILIPACSVGAPHRRDRVWFIANRPDTGIESMQFNGENRILETRITPDSNSDDARRHRYGKVRRAPGTSQTKQKEWERLRSDIERVSPKGIVANSSDSRLQRSKQFGNIGKEREKSKNEQSFRLFLTKWQNFPTQSPVCCGDDGLSSRLDANALLNGRKPKGKYVTFSHWRKESVKAYGNAIVPQVAYEIFKAVEEVNNMSEQFKSRK